MTDQVLSKEEILHISKLVNLILTESEIETFGPKLSETISYIKNLSDLQTKNSGGISHNTNLQNITFEDGEKNTRGLKISSLSQNATIKNNNFAVNRII